MKQAISKDAKRNNQTIQGNWRTSLVILIIGLILTIISSFLLQKEVRIQDKAKFELLCNEIKTKIESRLYAHATLLRNGAAFFAASDSVKRQDWKIFIENSRFDLNLPGIEGVGYVTIIPNDQLQSHIRNVRKEGFHDYTVKPSGYRDIYTSIVYIEPFTERNLRAFGYDMFSEPVRKKAMEKARDSDMASLTGKVTLVQESGPDIQAGTLMYVPVYRHGMSTKSVIERRKAIAGWVYSPYRMNDLMNGILGPWELPNGNKIRLQIYDDENISKNSLLFDSHPTDSPQSQLTFHTHSISLDFKGKKWTLNFIQFKRKLSFVNETVLVVFVAGILVSILLAVLYLTLSKAIIRMKISEKLAIQLKESEEKYRALIENTNEAIYIIQNERVVFANKACELILSVSINEIVGRKTNELLLNEENTRLSQYRQRLITEKPYSQKGEFLITNLKNEKHWLLINSVRIMWNDEVAVLNMATDITERKLAELEIIDLNKTLEIKVKERTDKLAEANANLRKEIEERKKIEFEINKARTAAEEANTSKDEFLSRMSHELRTPLNAILGFAQLLDMGELNPSQKKGVSRILQGGQYLLELVNEVLDIAQLNQGDLEISIEPLKISEILPKALEPLQVLAQEQQVNIKIQQNIDDQIKVKADRKRLMQILTNLISNAIKYNKIGGSVLIQTEIRKMNPNYFRILVIDTGYGIRQEDIRKLFKPFEHIDSPNSKFDGSGLGLALVKKLVDSLGGAVGVESKFEEGSTFWIELPIAEM